MDEAHRLKNRVKELRQRLGLRQADLAAQIGVTRQTVLAIEKGRLNPSVMVSLKIARILREPVDYVFFLAPAEDAAAAPVSQSEPAAAPPAAKKRTKASPPAILDLPAAEESNDSAPIASPAGDQKNPSSPDSQSIWDFV